VAIAFYGRLSDVKLIHGATKLSVSRGQLKLGEALCVYEYITIVSPDDKTVTEPRFQEPVGPVFLDVFRTFKKFLCDTQESRL
jgi:hypothetical protein